MADNPDEAPGELGPPSVDLPAVPHSPSPQVGGAMADFGRSEDDVARAVEAVLWRHSRTDPLAAKSRCSGGEVRCALPMDADAFYKHQARAVVDEVLVPEFETYIGQVHLVTQTIGRIADLPAFAVQHEAQRMGRGPLDSSHTKPKRGVDFRWWKLSCWGVFFLVLAGTLILNGLLKSCGG